MIQQNNLFKEMVPKVGRDKRGMYFDYPTAITFGELTVEGSVGHEHYARLFGKARELFGIECIPGFIDDVGKKYFLFTCRAEYSFSDNIFFGDNIIVRVWVSKAGESSFTLDGEFINGQGKICATARHIIVYVDVATRQKGMPEWFKKNMENAIGKN
ncbi:MAG TPA: acyl-CoA thioesterase [Candidatus Pacearchaeota archaeon]|jgi:acyl-CoA thioesterase FadM|nr:acyl-CoA thioesterase [Candidatus Pacearchaeota archaeon]